MSSFKPGMSPEEKLVVLGEGHPGTIRILGALHALRDTFSLSEDLLDVVGRLNITGLNIYRLYNEACGRDLECLAVLLVLADAGLNDLSREKLLHAARSYGEGIDIDEIMDQIDDVAKEVRRRMGRS